MNLPLSVRPATEAEWPTALAMAFGNLAERDQAARVRTAKEMIARGELDPEGIWFATDSIGPAGAMIVAALPGAGAVVWPPQVRPSLHEPCSVEDALITAALQWMRKRQVRIAQSLLLAEEIPSGESLLRNGFQRITRLLYLRHFLDLSAEELAQPEKLRYVRTDQLDAAIVEHTLVSTYIGSLDCPELNERRTPAEFLAGHRSHTDHDPEIWWLAYSGNNPAGALLLNVAEPDTWDIAYLGVAPEFRRRGVGRELVRKALFEAKAAEMLTVTLALDERNEPARRLYHSCGFEAFDDREVLLAVLD